MKKFFILKDEFFTRKENLKTPKLIFDERTLRQAINGNTISKYRPIDTFREGSIVKLRETRGLIWNEEMIEDHSSQVVTLVNDPSESFLIDFKENHNDWKFYVDSIAEVIKY